MVNSMGSMEEITMLFPEILQGSSTSLPANSNPSMEDVHFRRPAPSLAPAPPVSESTMVPKMYLAAQNGDVDYLNSSIEENRSSITFLASMLTPQNNTILHLAATFMQPEFAAKVLQHEKPLLFRPNSKHDTPLHIAARSGDLRMVNLLIQHYRESTTTASQQLPVDVESGTPQWRAINYDGNTALHEALICKEPRVARLLLKEDPGLADSVNNSMESPLYLAANLGFECVVKSIICIQLEHTISLKGPLGRTPLHGVVLFWPYVEKRSGTRQAFADGFWPVVETSSRSGQEFARLGGIAVNWLAKQTRDEAFARQEVITRLLCEKVPSVLRQTDDFGRTALHYAAGIGALELTCILLEADRSLAYIADNNGMTPLFVALAFERERIINMILHQCPDCAELHDLNGQNALHLVMRDNLLYLLKTMNHPAFKELLNERDNDGNTPLHLAVKTCFDSGINHLLKEKGINLRTRNAKGHTALDLLENWNNVIMKSNFKRKLLCHGATRAGRETFGLRSLIQQNIRPSVDELKKLANTLLVVTTLVLTVSFTAAFTLPGGYSQDPSDTGLAVLGKKAAFQAFLFCDAVAVWSSMACAYFLIVGLIGKGLLLSAVLHAVWWLTVAFFATMIAFSTGLYLVTENKCKWLAILVILMSCAIPLWLTVSGKVTLSLTAPQGNDKSAEKILEEHLFS